jgi:cytoskeleton protein RodZ
MEERNMEESFGSSLRRERELRFIELKEISQATMINLRFLEAIENDDFDSLPHSTFVRGFLRAYAKYVGLNPDEVVTNYEHYLQSAEGEEVQEQSEGGIQSINYPKLGVWAGALVVLLVGGVLVYLGLRGGESPPGGLSSEHETVSAVTPSPEPVAPPAEESLPVAAEPESAAPEKAAPAGKKLPPASPAGEAPAGEGQALPVAPAPAEQPSSMVGPPHPTAPALEEEIASALAETAEGEGVELVLKAVEESWVLFRLDDEPEADMIMPAGGTKTLKARTKIVLTVGNAAGVELTLNGKPLPPLGKPGQVVRGLVFEVGAEAGTKEKQYIIKEEQRQNEARPQG